MDYYPFTHGLVGSAAWAGLAFLLYYFVFAKGKATRTGIAWAMALGVLSHWFVDLIVHRPDLPILSGPPKFGFNLWQNRDLAFGVEALLLLAGWYYYHTKTEAVNSLGKYLALGYVVFLLLVNYLNFYILPHNNDVVSLTISALFFYFLFAGLAQWVGRYRQARSAA